MVLTVNAAVDAIGNNDGTCDDENESPPGCGSGGGKQQPVLSPSKRKSELISPSAASRWRRGDREGARGAAAASFSSRNDSKDGGLHATTRSPLSDVNSKAPPPALPASAPYTPKKPPTPAARAKFNGSAFKHPHHLRARPSKEEVEATDEKRSSVNQLSEWLAIESAKKKNRKKKLPSSNAAMTPCPISFHAKPRIKKCDVEATDSKRVSVKTLGAWMSGDPFEQRKVRTIRSSHRIIVKSRAFERADNAKLARENDIRAGSVNERRDWLAREAFKHENDGEEVPQRAVLGEKKLRPYQCKQKETPEKELKSVRDKKEWLSKAFKKGGDNEGQRGIRETDSIEAQQQRLLVKCASADQYAVEHGSVGNTSMIRPAKSYDCGATTSAASTVGVQGKSPSTPERQPSVVRLYRRDSSKLLDDEGDGENQNDAGVEGTPSPKKSVHDRQAWLSSAFKKRQDQQKSDREAAVTELAEDGERGKPRITSTETMDTNDVNKHETNHDKNSVGDGQRDCDDGDGLKENMSVADRAAWLRGAFKGK
mmetsp:Transcript_8066/g.19849  ORF Transcript_8066/g.19849 Transcript_8066/m.19849 type:complete len:539 (+) Transcript_8066:109-1725(+)